MAQLVLQVGQCGNQVSTEYFRQAAELFVRPLADPDLLYPSDELETAKEVFFRETANGRLYARAVVVDTEPKVVTQCIAAARAGGLYEYHGRSSWTGEDGAGNNWAYGYMSQAPKARGFVLDRLRKESEAADRVASVVLAQSLAGGTGSGVGTHMAYCVADEFCKIPLVSSVVWPYSAGEVVTAPYNAALTMAALHDVASLVISHENDAVREVLSKLGVRSPSLSDVNRMIAADLLAVTAPTAQAGSPLRTAVDCIADPALKVTTAIHAPRMPPPRQTALSLAAAAPGELLPWKQLLRAAETVAGNGYAALQGVGRHVYSTSGSILIARGEGAAAVAGALAGVDGVHVLTSSLSQLRGSSPVACGGRSGGTALRTVGLLTNSNSVALTLSAHASRAQKLVESGAYVHHFAAHGVTSEEINAAVGTVMTVASWYDRSASMVPVPALADRVS